MIRDLTRTVAIVLVAAITIGCGGTPPSSPGSSEPAALATGSAPGLPTPKPTVIPVPKHEVYGYVPYWEMDESIAAHIGGTELTTLALFSVTHRRNGKLDNQNGLRRIRGDVGGAMIRAARRQGARVEIVYTILRQRQEPRLLRRPQGAGALDRRDHRPGRGARP